MEHGLVIEPPRTKEQTRELRELALSTGMEENEIDEMIGADKVFLAKRKGITVGFIALRNDSDVRDLEIVGLAIRRDQRRRGFARLLLKHAEGFAHLCESKQMIVKTSNDNIPALALYQENGFIIREVRTGSLILHHGDREVLGWKNIPVRDEVILEKSLTQ